MIDAQAGRARRASLQSGAFVLPGLIFLLVFFLYPLFGVVLRSFDQAGVLNFAPGNFSLVNYREVLTDRAYLVILRNTFIVAAVATGATVVIAYPTCFLLSRLPHRWGAWLLIISLFPFWTSILVRLYAFTQILPLFGVMYTTTATIIGMVYYLLPYMIAILYANMVTIDDELLNAARTLGAGSFQALRWVFMPLTRSAVYVGTVMLFVISLGFFLTPAILGGGSDLTIATYIQQQVNIVNWGVASAMGSLLMALTLGLFFFAARYFSDDALPAIGATSQKGVARSEPFRLTWTTGLAVASTIMTFVFLLAPLVIVVFVSFTPTTYLAFPPKGFSLRWYEEFFRNWDWISSAWLSFRVAALTMVCASALGLISAIGIERARLPGKPLIRAMFLAPLIVPVILIAVALYDFENRLHMAGSITGYVIGHTLLALPITVMVMGNALRSVGTELEDAARTLGASPSRAFSLVTARLIAPSLAVSALFAFVTSWDEPVVALFLSTGATTLPVHIFNYIQSEVRPTVAAIATMLMTAVLLVGLASLAFGAARRRRLGVIAASRTMPP